MVYIGYNSKVIKPVLLAISGLATAASSGAAYGIIPRIAGTITVGGTAAAAETTLVVTVGALTAAASGVVSATNYALDKVQNRVVSDFSRGGYHKLLPGQTFTSAKYSPSFNLRAWVVRIQQTNDAIIIRRADASVWTGAANGSNVNYNVMDRTYFTKWRTETIPIRVHVPTETPADFDSEYSMLNAGETQLNCTEEDVSWVHVHKGESSENSDHHDRMAHDETTEVGSS
eukprot:CAMPEP_0185731312 /NCGR_PEP_ID=MMETSP1171-20130828/12541_1 /TAXON_ID=374046 /ORGANISM="Helicotheca tamensis, Strain CCMP826" /LENGTH=229 /DNA_ID=CAMNT_0028400549 /DNA_START=172 /DNA_END=861 /DNA_ORIENTATION=+